MERGHVELLGGAVQHHGALIVRGLLGRDDVDRSIEAQHLARTQQARHFDGQPSDDGWFVPLNTGSKVDAVMRRRNLDPRLVRVIELRPRAAAARSCARGPRRW